MTDLSTSNLKRLLAEERRNPPKMRWTYKGAASSSIHHEYPSKHEEIYGMRVEMELSRLVALGPEVAQELLTLRDALHDLSEVWEDVSIDPARTPAEQQLAAAVVDHIDQILGDHDE